MAKQKILSEDEAHKLAEDPSTTASTLSHIVQSHSEHPHIVQAIAKHPNADAKTLHYAFKTGMADSALEHPNVSPQTVDAAYDQLVKPKPISELSDTQHGDIIMHPKLSPINREHVVSKIMDEPKLDYDQRSILNRYFDSDLASPDMVYKGMSNNNSSTKSSALKSKMMTDHHVSNAIVDGLLNYDDAKTLASNEHISPTSLALLYDKFHNKGADTSRWNNLENAVADNPNTSTATLKKIYQLPDHGGQRSNILKHPNFPLSDVMKEMKTGDDSDVMRALVSRPDTPESTLRDMNSRAGKIDKWGWRNDMLRHPNFPEDLQIMRAREGAHAAYSVLKRRDLPEVVLRSLANSKNANVVEEALKHKSVTPNVVKEAFNRKHKEISTLASKHPLLPSDLKMQAILANPETAAHAASTSTDPIVLKQIHDRYPANWKLKTALMRNKYLDQSTMDDIVDHLEGGVAGGHVKWPDVSDHPALSKKSAKKMAKNYNAAMDLIRGGYGFNDKDMEEILEHHNREEGHQSTRQIGAKVMLHPGASPDLLKKIVMGQYGNPDIYHNINELERMVAKNPETYNKSVVDAAMSTPHELTNKAMVGAIARSTPHLSNDEIKMHVDMADASQHGNDSRSSADHNRYVASQLMHNDNAKPELLDDIVKQNLLGAISGNPKHIDVAEEAVRNNKLPIEKIADYLSSPVYQGAWHKTKAIGAMVDRIKEHDDPTVKASLTENSPSVDLVHALISRPSPYGGSRRMEPVENFMSSLKNPHPEVLTNVLDSPTLSGELKGPDHHWDMDDRLKAQASIDDLVGHEEPTVVGAAFPLMSPGAQEKVLRGRDLSTVPELIPGLSEESLKNIKVGPHMSPEVVGEILDHPKVRWEHMYDAVDHSEDMAAKVRRKASDILERKRSSANEESLDHIDNKILDKYPNSNLAANIARHTKDPKAIERIMGDDKLKGLRKFVVNNDIARGKDLDHFVGIVGPGNEDLARSLAEHGKASVRLLAHIARTYPDLADTVASHPKATSNKVYPHIVNSKNDIAIQRLVNQPSLPSDVRDELVKDPSTYLNIRNPDLLSGDRVSEIAHGTDPSLVERALAKNVMSKDQVDSAIKHAVNTFTGDNLDSVLNSAAKIKLGSLSPESMRLIADKSPHSSTMKILLDNHTVPDDLLSRAMDTYNTPDMIGHVLDNMDLRIDDNYNKIDKEVRSKLINMIDLDSRYNISSIGYVNGSKAVSRLLDKTDESNLKETDFGGILDKLESSTPKDERDIKAKSDLLNTLATLSDDKTLDRLSSYPEAYSNMLDNPRLSEDTYKKIVDSLPETYKMLSDKYAGGFRFLFEVLNNKHCSTDSVQKVYDVGKNNKNVLDAVAANPRVSDSLFRELLDKNVSGALEQDRIGSQGVKEKVDQLAENLSGPNAKQISSVMKNPHFKVKDFIDSAEKHGNYVPRITEHLSDFLKNNLNASEEDLSHISDFIYRNDEIPHPYLVPLVIKNYNTPADAVKKLIDKGVVSEANAYHNPKIGGELWRSKSHPFPNVPGVKRGNEINEASFVPQLEKMREAASKLPPEGYLDWAQFKKDNPSLAGNPAVQRMFTSAPKQRLTAEEASQYIDSAPSKKFHVSYTMWTGMQRHNNAKQLVVQINNGPAQDEILKTDPDTFRLFKMIQQASYHSSHPVNPQSIGWSRVDTSDKDHWFIDEVQSDLNAGISHELAKMKEQEGTEEKLKEKFGLTAKTADKALNKVMEVIHGWEKAIIDNVIRTAQAHGVKKVSIQSGKSKTLVNKGDDSEVTRKYDKIYNVLPQDMGFKADKYDNVPSASHKSKLKGEPVWTLDVPAVTKKSEIYGNLSKSSLKKIVEAVKNLTNNGGVLTSMKEHSPETYQAAMDNIKALQDVLKQAGFQIGAPRAPTEEPAKSTPPETKPEMPKASSDKPITHGKLVFGPGAVRNYGGSDERQKDPSGDWHHISRQGDEPNKDEGSK